VDLFRRESITLKNRWVVVVMDQFSRRIIGFDVHAGDVDGIALCCLFNKAISRHGTPAYLSSDNDPLIRYHRWKANLRILDVEEIKCIPYVRLSHPFVERLIGTIRREYLDHTLFWNASDLDRKLGEFRHYYNRHRVHDSLQRNTLAETSRESIIRGTDLSNYGGMTPCRGLYQLPITAWVTIRHGRVASRARPRSFCRHLSSTLLPRRDDSDLDLCRSPAAYSRTALCDPRASRTCVRRRAQIPRTGDRKAGFRYRLPNTTQTCPKSSDRNHQAARCMLKMGNFRP
jgi:hypothetical protein